MGIKAYFWKEMLHSVQSGEIKKNHIGRCVFSVINISELCILLEIILMGLVPDKSERQISLLLHS